jgi:fatty-acid desaturase
MIGNMNKLTKTLFLTGFGVTVGSHRYFAHKSFKANQKLKVFLVMIQTLSGLDAILVKYLNFC